MKKTNVKYYVTLTVISAVIYILLDLPLRMTGFLEFGGFIGIKNCLPAILGLLFGWYGALGCLVGSVTCSVLTAAPFPELVFEALGVSVFAVGIWLLWHVGAPSHRVHLKRAGDYLKYCLLTGLMAAACGALSSVLLPSGSFLTVFIGYFAMSLLVGIPVIILLTSIVCVIPVMPPSCRMMPDVADGISKQPGSLEAFFEKLDQCAGERGIGMKSLFGIQSCIEEVMILVLENDPDATVTTRLYYDDSTSLWFEYQGERYNPFRTERKAESEDMFGLQLILHRALRASYKYSHGVNRIHIVI